ncbi:hypothetical protein Goshw_015758, partial [Gossypium schwendimanii]|nr:hypothetical protein [Gossypium schwendimanii]
GLETHKRVGGEVETGEYSFHLPCDECTITLEDIHLQLGLPVGGLVVIGFVQSTDQGVIVEDLTEVEREQYIRGYILQIIEGILIPDKSRNLVHLRLLLKLVNFRVAREYSWGFTMLSIPMAHQEFDDLHLIDLRRQDENWSIFHWQHINMWNHRYDFLPTRQPIIIPELACDSEYMHGLGSMASHICIGKKAYLCSLISFLVVQLCIVFQFRDSR